MKKILLMLVAFMLTTTAFTQTIIKGKITDGETGAILSGATISIPGSKKIVQADKNGLFEILYDKGFQHISISCIGYEPQQLAIDSTTKFINAVMNVTTTCLNTVMVTGYETNRKLLETAGAVVLISSKDIQRSDNMSILSALNNVAGVKMEQSANGDYRISIRGSALRDPWGIRNLKLYWNGIPLTSPDNSASHSLDFEPTQIGSMEIIKGPAGSIYGAGNGGVILFKNDKAKQDENSLTIGTTAGSYGFNRINTIYKTSTDNFNLSANYVHQTYTGYRQNGWSNKDAVNIFSQIYASPKRTVSFIINHSEGSFGISGSVDSAWAVTTPRKAVQYCINNRTGVKKYTYTLLGASQEYKINNQFTNTTGLYGSFQTLDHPYGQSPSYNGFLKQSTGGYGGRTSFTYAPVIGTIKSRFTAGAEIQYENQLGNTFDIVTDSIVGTGPLTGNLQTSNLVIAQSNIIFGQAEFDLPKNFLITLGASLNHLSYDITDLVPQSSNHNNYTGIINFKSDITPRIALVQKISNNIATHASISYGFSPPSEAEINNGDGTFNKNLNPEKGINYELGLRGVILNNKLNFDASVYQMNLTNAILPVYNQYGTASYSNAGATMQKGFELSLFYYAINNKNNSLTLLKPWITYAYNNARFKNYDKESFDWANYIPVKNNYTGKKVTGIIPNTLNAGIDLEMKTGIYFNVVYNYIDKAPMNDANTYYQNAYSLLAGKIGYRKAFGKLAADIFIGGNNLLDTKYSSQVNLNADESGSLNFFNPSAGQNFYGGVSLKYNFK